MRCLVTGGAGFIGSNLVRALLAGGHSVSVLDDLSTGHIENLLDCQRSAVVVGDVTDLRLVVSTSQDADVVFHLAASVGNTRSMKSPHLDATVNVLGTLSVLNACVLEASRHVRPRIVYSSSAGIFGQLKNLPISEDHPCEPDSPYGCTKLCAEKLGLVYAKLYGIHVTCLRYFNVYGPGQRWDAYGNVIPIFADKLARGEPLTIYGDGQQTRDFVSVHDVVQANLLAAFADQPGGAYNIGSGVGLQINELARLMDATSIRREDPRAGDVLHSVADISRAKQLLGYSPRISIREGLGEYLDWFNQYRREDAA